MSDLHNTNAAALPTEAEPATMAPTHQAEVFPTEGTAPLTDTKPAMNSEPMMSTQEPQIAPVEETKAATAPVIPEKAAERSVEPISEGQLAVKGPGLIKQIVPSKKEFWLSDAPITPQHMDLYLRGEKAEISHAVVAWASQTGKGLLFFNKKGETERKRPHSVLPLYDATDLKKGHPHEISFKLHGETHTLKAVNDAERDGWFISLERAVEVGKAEKVSIRASEGYKAEMEKLNRPNMMHAGGAATGAAAGGVAGAAAMRSKSHGKSTDEPRRAASDPEDVAAPQKSRSTSRGMLGRLTGKKDEPETKREVKKEEKHEEKEEKIMAKEERKAEKEEAKAEKHAEKHGEAAPVAVLAGGAAFDAPSTAERVFGAPVEEPSAEIAPVAGGIPTTDEKPKVAKRGSIFGRVQSGWGSMKSPVKEKDLKDAELKPQVPPKDAGVSETAPQIPEPTQEPEVLADKPMDNAELNTHGKPAEAAKEQLDGLSPMPEKKAGFLSSLPFMAKRDRSASPSALKDAPVNQEAAPAVPPKGDGIAAAGPSAGEPTLAEPAIAEPAVAPSAVEEPVAPIHETSATELAGEKAMTNTEEPIPTAATDATSPPSAKRQSVLGGFGLLGRRASKAFKGMQSPKRENANPLAGPESKIEQPKEVVPGSTAAETPAANGETRVAEAMEPERLAGGAEHDDMHIGQAQTTNAVTASA
ncbi:hypothetical protein LTR12_003536 [Friedmanniomyces endolithicus]|nr:hypothetical protein LTR74_005443 [Friedmanniomyces endolithicus]KAK1822012.1 hypothetical protein LTR12_003536 [Friedmanniomyces endolithicus]